MGESRECEISAALSHAVYKQRTRALSIFPSSSHITLHRSAWVCLRYHQKSLTHCLTLSESIMSDSKKSATVKALVNKMYGVVTGLVNHFKSSSSNSKRAPTGVSPDQTHRLDTHQEPPLVAPKITRHKRINTGINLPIIPPRKSAEVTIDNCSIVKVARDGSKCPRLEVDSQFRDANIRGWLGGVSQPHMPSIVDVQ